MKNCIQTAIKMGAKSQKGTHLRKFVWKDFLLYGEGNREMPQLIVSEHRRLIFVIIVCLIFFWAHKTPFYLFVLFYFSQYILILYLLFLSQIPNVSPSK